LNGHQKVQGAVEEDQEGKKKVGLAHMNLLHDLISHQLSQGKLNPGRPEFIY